MYDNESSPYMQMLKMQQSLWQHWGDSMQPSKQSAQPGYAFNPSAAATPGGLGAWPQMFNQAAGSNPWAGFSQWNMPASLWGNWQRQWTELCSGFTGLAQKISEASASGGSTANAADWMPLFDETFNRLKGSFASGNTENAKWVADMCRLQFGNGMDTANPFMGAPKLGPMRQQQQDMEEHMQKVAKLAECSGKYIDYIGQTPMQALDLLREKLLQSAHNDQAITSVRELYDMWVDCMDTAGKELVATEQYPKLYADVNNALLHVLDGSKKQMDGYNKLYGQPTRAAFNTLARRQHLQGRAIQSEILPNLGHMHNEIKELRQQLQQLQQLVQQGQQDWQEPLAAMKKMLDDHSQALLDIAGQATPSPEQGEAAATTSESDDDGNSEVGDKS